MGILHNSLELFFAVGIFLFIAVAVVILGGLKRIASITEKLVPFMVVIYFVGAIIIIFIHVGQIPAIFAAIFKCAFTYTKRRVCI